MAGPRQEIVSAQPGVYYLLLQTVKDTGAVDFADMRSWCRAKGPVVAWLLTQSAQDDAWECDSLTIGNAQIKGDAYLFPDGQVYSEAHENTFPSMAAFLAFQYDLDNPPEEFHTEPGPVAAKPPSAPVEAASAPPGVEPTLRDLGISGRACAPLERMGITTLLQLCRHDRKSIKDTRGVSADAVKEMDALLSKRGLRWGMNDEEPAVMSALNAEPDDEPEDLM